MAATSPLAAQQAVGAVEGKVMADGGVTAVSGAAIILVGTTRETRAGNDGKFRLDNIAVGRHTILIRAVGWEPQQVEVEVRAGATTPLNVSLAARAALLSEVIVSVSQESQSRAEATASVGVIDAAELGRALAHHPADIVSRVPGAWVANLSGEGHMTAIRQPITTKPVYLFLEDGVPTRSTGFFNHNGLYEINLPMADRVEIIKGPGSSLYGSDAIGGVINAYTRAPSASPTGEFFVEGGRDGYLRTLATVSRAFGADALRADLNVTRSDGFRAAASYARQSGTLRWDRALGDAQLKSVVTFTHVDQPGDGGGDVAEADFLAGRLSGITPVAFRRVIALRGSSALTVRRGLGQVDATVYARYNTMDLLPSWQLSFDPQVWEVGNQSVGMIGRYRRVLPSLRSTLSGGVDLEVSPGTHKETGIVPSKTGPVFTGYTEGEVQYDYDVTFWQASPYLQLESYPVSRLRLELGLRADQAGYRYDNKLSELQSGAHRRPASGEVSYNRVSPKLGLAWTPVDGLHAYASYRAAFRAPSEGQLFRQGSAVSTLDLRPVKADNYEAGIRFEAGSRVSGEVTAYQLDIEDDILTFFNPGTGLRTATNAGATRHRGVEVGLAARPFATLRADVSWAYTDQKYRDWKPNTTVDYSGNTIEVAPRTMGRTGLTWTPSFLGDGHLSAEWVHQGRYAMDPSNAEWAEGFDVLHLSGAAPVSSSLELVGRVQNLTDERFAEMSSFTTSQGRRYRPGQPRAVYLGLRYRIGGQ